MKQHGSIYVGNFRIEAAYDPHCFQMTEITIIQNFEKVRLLLSRSLDNSV